MTRLHNWPELLAQAVDALQGKEFKFGSFDCCIAAASLIEAVTGTDLMADLKSKYTDEASADVLIQSLGADLSGAVSNVAEDHGLKSIPPLMASRGDLVIVLLNDQQIVGVVGTDARYALCATTKGLLRVPISQVTKAWRI